jgi:hypothetical protein
MLTTTGLLYAGGMAGIIFVSRVWTKYKLDARAKHEETLPLFDLVQLEIATTSQADDDADVLAEIRETFTRLNRRRFATEVWALDTQLAKYYARLPNQSRQTMRCVLLRFIQSEDGWLQIVGAKTSAALSLREHGAAIQELLERQPEAGADRALQRFRDEVEAAAVKLR